MFSAQASMAQHKAKLDIQQEENKILEFICLFGNFDMESLQFYLPKTYPEASKLLDANDKKMLLKVFDQIEDMTKQFPRSKRESVVKNAFNLFERNSKEGTKKVINQQNERYIQGEIQSMYHQLQYKEDIVRKYKEQAQMLERKNQENLDRISKMMAAQEIGRRDAHENLMDSNRPSVIAEKLRSLYLNEYGMLSAELQEKICMTEKDSSIFLVSILESAMDKCRLKVEQAKKEVTGKLEDVFQTNPKVLFTLILKCCEQLILANLKKPFAAGTKQPLSKHVFENICSLLREAPHEEVLLCIKQSILTEMKEGDQENICKILRYIGDDSEALSRYLSECVHVTWLMNSCNPPMAITSHHQKYNRKMHQMFDGKGAYIDYFLWPCLYFSEDYKASNGNVMSKGEVSLMQSPRPHESETTALHKPVDIPQEQATQFSKEIFDKYPVPGIAKKVIETETANSGKEPNLNIEEGNKLSSREDVSPDSVGNTYHVMQYQTHGSNPCPINSNFQSKHHKVESTKLNQGSSLKNSDEKQGWLPKIDAKSRNKRGHETAI